MLSSFNNIYFGMRIEYTSNAMQETTERLFPESRNRSRRIHKKLVKRFGGVYRKIPVMLRIGDVIYAHPSYKAALEEAARPRP